MEKIFLLIFLMLTSPFVFSQDKSSQEAKEVVNQFLSALFNNTLTSENMNKYVAPRTFKPALSLMSLEDYFNVTTDSDDPEKILEIAFLKEILSFGLEGSSYKIGKVQKLNNFEYSVQVSFKLLLSSSFVSRMSEYVEDYYVDSLRTEEERVKRQSSFTTGDEMFNFLMELMREGAKEFQKLPLKDSDFIHSTYTFKVARVSEKDTLRIVFASNKDIKDFYETFLD